MTATGTSLQWYSATGGTCSTSAPTPSTSAVGITAYYVSRTANGCESDRAQITVTVSDPPDNHVVTGGGTYCPGGTGVIVGLDNSRTGINYQLLVNDEAIGNALPGTGSALSFGNLTTQGTYTVQATKGTAPGCSIAMTGSATIKHSTLPSCPVISLKTGDWEDSATWNVGRAPLPSEQVILGEGRLISLHGTAIILGLEYSLNAQLLFVGGNSNLRFGQ